METRKNCDFALYLKDSSEGEVKIRSFVKGISSKDKSNNTFLY
jgi:hypothetical protein